MYAYHIHIFSLQIFPLVPSRPCRLRQNERADITIILEPGYEKIPRSERVYLQAYQVLARRTAHKKRTKIIVTYHFHKLKVRGKIGGRGAVDKEKPIRSQIGSINTVVLIYSVASFLRLSSTAFPHPSSLCSSSSSSLSSLSAEVQPLSPSSPSSSSSSSSSSTLLFHDRSCCRIISDHFSNVKKERRRRRKRVES